MEEPGKVLERDIYIYQLIIFQTPTLHGDFFNKYCIRVWLSEERQGFSFKSDVFSE